MFSQLGPAARAIVTLAEQECRNASHYYLGTEHLLLAMAIAPPQDVARYFHSVHLEPWQVKRALRDALAVTFEHTWNGIIVTERVKRIIDIAASNKGRSTLIAPIDLLQAMITEGRGIAARVLADLAVGAASTGRT